MKRIPCVGCLALVAALAASAFDHTDARSPRYVHDDTLYLGSVRTAGLAFDPGANRLWVGDPNGLRWIDLAQSKPRLAGPFAKMRITGDVEFAANIDRLFFEVDDDDIAFIDVRTSSAPKRIGRLPRAAELVYEPLRKELYVFSSTERVLVFDAVSGERAATIELPGWLGRTPVAMAGKVYLTIARKDGVFAIDGATRRVEPIAVGSRTGTPFGIEADAANGRLFLAYAREIVAFDPASGAVPGHVVTNSPPAIAYDAGAGLLIATNIEPGGKKTIDAYRLDANGLVRVDRTSWVDPGTGSLEPIRNGFVQVGSISTGDDPARFQNTALLIWRAK